MQAYLDDRECKCWVGNHSPDVHPKDPRLLLIPCFPLQQLQNGVQFRCPRPTLPRIRAVPVRQQDDVQSRRLRPTLPDTPATRSDSEHRAPVLEDCSFTGLASVAPIWSSFGL